MKMIKSSSIRDSNEKLFNSVNCSHPDILPPVKSFVLKSNNTFACRASDVFSRLNFLENDHSTWMTNNETHQSFESVDAIADEPLNTSKIEEFKKPHLPVRRSKKHAIIRKQKNMRVWRKYSLKDIPLSSDAENAAAAFQFLNELQKKRKENTSDEMNLDGDDDKITFRKPTKRNLGQGQSTLSKNPSSSIRLHHLQDEFE